MKKHILLIEDDTFLSDILSKALVKAGFKLTLAGNGEDAVRFLEKENPDLILLDLVLPQMDGFGVLAKIRSGSNTAAIPVIILSNVNDQENLKKGEAMGVAAYLVKATTTPEEIIAKVKAVLNLP